MADIYPLKGTIAVTLLTLKMTPMNSFYDVNTFLYIWSVKPHKMATVSASKVRFLRDSSFFHVKSCQQSKTYSLLLGSNLYQKPCRQKIIRQKVFIKHCLLGDISSINSLFIRVLTSFSTLYRLLDKKDS